MSEITPKPRHSELTVVIPTLGRAILEESLYWLVMANSWPGGLIVVDQGQNNEVALWLSLLRELGIDAEYVPSQQRGRAAGVNRGLERAKTPFVAITDDDCFVDKAWVANLCRHLKSEPNSIVTGRIEAAGEGVVFTVTSTIAAVQTKPKLLFDHMSGGNMATSKEVLATTGLFDEDETVRTSEDGEFAYRALRAGIPIFYDPTLIVHHFGWREESGRSEQYLSYARSHGGFFGKYIGRGDLFIVARAITHFLRALRRWVRGVVQGNQEQALVGKAYVMGLFPGILAGIKRGKSDG